MNKIFQTPEQLLQELKELHDNVVPRLAANNMFHSQSIQMYDEFTNAKNKFVNMAFDYITSKTGIVDEVVIHSTADNKDTLIKCLWDVFNGSISKVKLRKMTQPSRHWYLNEAGIFTSNYVIGGVDCTTFEEHLANADLRGIGWNQYFKYERNRVVNQSNIISINDKNHPLKKVIPIFGLEGESLIDAVRAVLDAISSDDMPSFELIDTVVTISQDMHREIKDKHLSIGGSVHSLYDIASLDKIEKERGYYYKFMTMMENL